MGMSGLEEARMTADATLRTKPKNVQIADYYHALIEEGRILPGYRLPSIEEVRGTWQVSRDTAHAAMRELEARGVAEIRPRFGTFAAGQDRRRASA